MGERGGERGEDVEAPGMWSARGPRWLSAGLVKSLSARILSDTTRLMLKSKRSIVANVPLRNEITVDIGWPRKCSHCV